MCMGWNFSKRIPQEMGWGGLRKGWSQDSMGITDKTVKDFSAGHKGQLCRLHIVPYSRGRYILRCGVL